MDLSLKTNGELLPKARIAKLQRQHLLGMIIGYPGVEKMTLPQTVQLVRKDMKRILCGCEHHLVGNFYAHCSLFEINTACAHRERIRGLMHYMFGLLVAIRELNIPIVDETTLTSLKTRMYSLVYVTDYDEVGQRFGSSSDLIGDILHVKTTQNGEAAIVEGILNDLADKLEEAYLIDSGLINLLMSTRTPISMPRSCLDYR